MERKGWLTDKTHGNKFQSGWPDLYCHHPLHGGAWIEMKATKRKKLTRSQRGLFARWSKYGVRIWVLTGPEDYDLLFDEPNWKDFA